MPTYKEKQTTLRPVTEGFRSDQDLPVIPIRIEAQDAASASAHAHPRGQLIYASHGVVRVVTPMGTWLVPPTQAIWIPPDVEHDVFFPGKVTLFSLFVAKAECDQLTKACTVIKVSTLLRELIIRACDWGDAYRPQDAGYRFMQVLIDEMARAETTNIDLPSAKDERLIRVTEALAMSLRANPCQEQLAKLACVSPRTLARLFVQETGMTLGEYNRRFMVHQAISQLSAGKTVTAVAFNLGYRNPTSFVEMFRKTLGVSPKKYLMAK